MIQINSPDYWDKKYQEKSTGGKWGEKGYYFLDNILPVDNMFTALDIGCGKGNGIGFLKDQFPKAIFTGIDFSESGIKTAKLKHPNNMFYNSDCYNFDGGLFDYVFMIELLEHLRWPDKIIEKYLPMTRKAIYISIPVTNWDCDEHIYAYGDFVNPFEKFGAEVIGNINGRKKLVIRK